MNNKPYKLYTDKIRDFECQLYLEGIPLEHAKARMVVESKDTTLTFGGTINKKGKCSIPIGSLGNKLGNISGGLMRLEVFAGDIFFQPWKSSFIIEGRKFDELININGVNESTKNSLEIELELNNIKQDIKDISEKVDDHLITKEEKYDNSLKKWNIFNKGLPKVNNKKQEKNLKFLSEEKIPIITDTKEYKKTINKWSILDNELDEIVENIKEDNSDKKDYTDIVDKWGASTDEDFKI